jgi:hypothetical protein
VQSSETILGPIQQVGSPSIVTTSDPSEQVQQQGEKKSDKKSDSDDSGVDASLGLINAAPVQLKSDLEQPVTSGGMETINDIPGTPD